MTKYFDEDGNPLIFPEDMPQGYIDFITEAHQRRKDIRSDVELRFRRLLTESTQEQIETIRLLLGQVRNSQHAAYYYEGMTAAAGVIRFGTGGITIDPTLIGRSGVPGVDDLVDALDAMLASEGADTAPSSGVERIELDATSEPELPPSDECEKISSDMERYGVAPSGEGCGGTDSPVTCVHCGLEYVSLADRMLRGPSSCHGCQEKARWG